MKINKPLQEIMKKRNLILRDLYFKINEEIRLTRLSDIKVARVVPTKEEVEDLENMEIDKILIVNAEKINKIAWTFMDSL